MCLNPEALMILSAKGLCFTNSLCDGLINNRELCLKHQHNQLLKSPRNPLKTGKEAQSLMELGCQKARLKLTAGPVGPALPSLPRAPCEEEHDKQFKKRIEYQRKPQ